MVTALLNKKVLLAAEFTLLDVFFYIASDIQIHFGEVDIDINFGSCTNILSVSYTHLTLPTIA